VVFCSATFFCARKNASHFSLSGAKKRHLQPERYTTFFCPNFPQNQVQTVNIYKGEFWRFLMINYIILIFFLTNNIFRGIIDILKEYNNG